MLRIYLKQAWELMKQNRLFSTLYIVGTALAIDYLLCPPGAGLSGGAARHDPVYGQPEAV